MEYNDALKLAKYIKQNIKGLYIVGSLARKEKIINDIDFVSLIHPYLILNKLSLIFPNINILSKGSKYISVSIPEGVKIDVWFANNKDELNVMKVLRTIDKSHNIGYRKLAKSQGMKLTDKYLQYGDKIIYFKSEKELKNILDNNLIMDSCDKKCYNKNYI